MREVNEHANCRQKHADGFVRLAEQHPRHVAYCDVTKALLTVCADRSVMTLH